MARLANLPASSVPASGVDSQRSGGGQRAEFEHLGRAKCRMVPGNKTQLGQQAQVGVRRPAVGAQCHAHAGGQKLPPADSGSMAETGVRPRAIDHRQPVGMRRQKIDLVRVEVVAVNDQVRGAAVNCRR